MVGISYGFNVSDLVLILRTIFGENVEMLRKELAAFFLATAVTRGLAVPVK